MSAQTGIFADSRVAEKCLQQIVATAIKHSAVLVELSFEADASRAHFTLDKGTVSSVEIEATQADLIAVLLRNSVISEETPCLLKAKARMRFNSVSVDFKATISLQDHPAGPDRSPHAVRFSQFVIDVPDNPLFWHGLPRHVANDVRKMCEAESGVVIIASEKVRPRNFALRALADSFSDVYMMGHIDDLEKELALMHYSRPHKDRVVLAAVEASSIFEVLKQLETCPEKSKKLVRGILAAVEIPSLCPFCAEDSSADDTLLGLAAYTGAENTPSYRKKKGCKYCAETGLVGELTSFASLSLRESKAGEQLLAGASSQEFLSSLAAEDFCSLFENSIALAEEGKVSLERVQSIVKRPPEAYEFPRELSEHRADRDRGEDSEEVRFEDELTIRYLEASGYSLVAGGHSDAAMSAGAKMTLNPLRGADAFRLPSGETDLSQIDPSEFFDDRKTVLVVDDDEDLRTVLRRVFEKSGFNVVTAADGVDGIVTAMTSRPDIIIVDYMMPDLDGSKTIERLRRSKKTAEIPVIAISGYPDALTRERLFDAGANEFFAKPLSTTELLRTVECLVE